jgi:Leucine-rich repeat (LRR) protein
MNIDFINLSVNQLRRIVPMELGKLTQLQSLLLGSNQVVSRNTTNIPILTMLTNCSSLQELDLGSNHFT